MELNHQPLGFQPNALPLSYCSTIKIKNKFKKIKLKKKYKKKIKIKNFQFKYENWSNLYLGKVPRVNIANIQKNKILTNNTK